MSTITTPLASRADWPALNTAARKEDAQHRALERADGGAEGLDVAELKSGRAQAREAGVDTHGAAKLARRADTDGDRTLAADELEAKKSLVPPPKDTLDFVQRRLGAQDDGEPKPVLFDHIDADGDGGLRKSEFVAAGPTHRPGAADPTPDSAATTGGSDDAAYERLGKVFDAADRDGDGTLAHGEFIALKRETRADAADALGLPADADSLTASAAVAAYREDRFDLVKAAQTLADR